MTIYIILLLTLAQKPILASSHLLEQQLEPVVINPMTDSKIQTGRTYNEHPQARALAPKIKGYPLLDQLELLIYPGRDFKLENPGTRLVRLETAVFGDKQNGSIPQRLSRLQDEITSWQIANAQAMEIVSSNKKREHAFYSLNVRGSTLDANSTNYSHPLPLTSNVQHPTINNNHPVKQVDYDYMNYRATTPLVQTMARKAIEVMFQ